MITTTTNDRNECIWINESGREFVRVEVAFTGNGTTIEENIAHNTEACEAIANVRSGFESKGIKILDKADTGWHCQYNMIVFQVANHKWIFVSREVVDAETHYYEMEADKTRVLPYATVEELEMGEGDRAEMFRKFWYYNIPNQPHHSTDKWVWKVRDQAGECVKARDYHKLFKICRAASLKASCDEAVDAIAHIWDAMATCLYFMGVDTNHPYNLAEG